MSIRNDLIETFQVNRNTHYFNLLISLNVFTRIDKVVNVLKVNFIVQLKF